MIITEPMKNIFNIDWMLLFRGDNKYKTKGSSIAGTADIAKDININQIVIIDISRFGLSLLANHLAFFVWLYLL